MGSHAQERLHLPILQLGNSLSLAAIKPPRTIREIAALCRAVAPDMFNLRLVVGETGASALLGCLQKLLELDVPANLVKFMNLTLRAGHPMTQPSEATKKSCEIAAHLWAQAAVLFRELVQVCKRFPGEHHYELCLTVMDQLLPVTSNGDPGGIYTSGDLLQSNIGQLQNIRVPYSPESCVMNECRLVWKLRMFRHPYGVS